MPVSRMRSVNQLRNPLRNLAKFAGFYRLVHAKCRAFLQGNVFYVSQWHGALQIAGSFCAVRPEDLTIVYVVFCGVQIGQ